MAGRGGLGQRIDCSMQDTARTLMAPLLAGELHTPAAAAPPEDEESRDLPSTGSIPADTAYRLRSA